ncbi:caveolin-1-like [Sitophilus oryzae]|uniref:Caveolin n=1 Tax=Sitophilus oryzae TaxID=7048 RepID=A0A6J2XAI1_SITOR|nr:caveolin-1-like [Sitophilus oryzae]XP_030748247.1 caveolin-1-like [Sitophilus oryzae]
MSGREDLEDRDPKRINQHIQVEWEDIIGEPQTIRSPECAWCLSKHCYHYSKTGCFVCLSVLCAPLYACCAGFSFAILQFEHIWCSGPCLILLKISCGTIKKFLQLCTESIMIPIMEAIGYLFSKIHIRKSNISSDHLDQIDIEKKKVQIV